MLSFHNHHRSVISELRFNAAMLSKSIAEEKLDAHPITNRQQVVECTNRRATTFLPHNVSVGRCNEKDNHSNSEGPMVIAPLPCSNMPKWESIHCSVVDQGPLFISCAVMDQKSKQLLAIASLEKNRFSELVRFDIGAERWSGCTRTRHFRPPKRIGAAAAVARGHLFIFGGYELSNQLEGAKGSVAPAGGISSTGPLKTGSGWKSHHGRGPVSAHSVGMVDKLNRSIASSSSLIHLFGFPEWWLNTPQGTGVQLRPKMASSKLIDALGDFHGYDLCRGEWNALISRDNKPVVHSPSNPGNSSASWTWRSVHPGSSDSRFSCSRVEPQGQVPPYNSSRNVNHPNNNTTHLVAGNIPGDPLPSARAFHTLVRWGDLLVLFGGERTGVSPQSLTTSYYSDCEGCPVVHLNDVWVFNLKDMRWLLASEATVPLLPSQLIYPTSSLAPSELSCVKDLSSMWSFADHTGDASANHFAATGGENRDTTDRRSSSLEKPKSVATPLLQQKQKAQKLPQPQPLYSPPLSSSLSSLDASITWMESVPWRSSCLDVCGESRRATTSTTASIGDCGSISRPEDALAVPSLSWKGVPISSSASSSSSASLYDLSSPLLLPSMVEDSIYSGYTREDEGVPGVNILGSKPNKCRGLDATKKDTDNIPAPRSGHIAVIYHRMMYIYGGQNAWGPLDDAWAFDLRSFQWRCLKTTGISPGARFGHTAVPVGSGVWIYGGFTAEDLNTRRRCVATLSSTYKPCQYDTTAATALSLGNSIGAHRINGSNLCIAKAANNATCPPGFQFSDTHALYYLDFETLHWTEYHLKGSPPHDARYFGRLHGFYGHHALYLGGATGHETAHRGFEMVRVDLTSCFPEALTQRPSLSSREVELEALRMMKQLLCENVNGMNEKKKPLLPLLSPKEPVMYVNQRCITENTGEVRCGDIQQRKTDKWHENKSASSNIGINDRGIQRANEACCRGEATTSSMGSGLSSASFHSAETSFGSSMVTSIPHEKEAGRTLRGFHVAQLTHDTTWRRLGSGAIPHKADSLSVDAAYRKDAPYVIPSPCYNDEPSSLIPSLLSTSAHGLSESDPRDRCTRATQKDNAYEIPRSMVSAEHGAVIGSTTMTPSCPSLMDPSLLLSPRIHSLKSDSKTRAAAACAENTIRGVAPSEPWWDAFLERSGGAEVSPLLLLQSLFGDPPCNSDASRMVTTTNYDDGDAGTVSSQDAKTWKEVQHPFLGDNSLWSTMDDQHLLMPAGLPSSPKCIRPVPESTWEHIRNDKQYQSSLLGPSIQQQEATWRRDESPVRQWMPQVASSRECNAPTCGNDCTHVRPASDPGVTSCCLPVLGGSTASPWCCVTWPTATNHADTQNEIISERPAVVPPERLVAVYDPEPPVPIQEKDAELLWEMDTLNAQVEKQKEENSVLKDALLYLIPYLHLEQLAHALKDGTETTGSSVPSNCTSRTTTEVVQDATQEETKSSSSELPDPFTHPKRENSACPISRGCGLPLTESSHHRSLCYAVQHDGVKSCAYVDPSLPSLQYDTRKEGSP